MVKAPPTCASEAVKAFLSANRIIGIKKLYFLPQCKINLQLIEMNDKMDVTGS